MASIKDTCSSFYKNNTWVLFRKADGKIGVLAESTKKPNGEIVMTVQGDFEKACRYAADIESGASTQYSLFDFIEENHGQQK